LNLQHTATGVNLKHISNDSIDYTFEIVDGDTNAPVNFSGYTTARMSLKENEFSAAIVTFHSTGATYQINMTDKAIGKIRIIANNTSSITPNTYLYNLELSNSTTRETIISGVITAVTDITT
jgi:hypothetical protein